MPEASLPLPDRRRPVLRWIAGLLPGAIVLCCLGIETVHADPESPAGKSPPVAGESPSRTPAPAEEDADEPGEAGREEAIAGEEEEEEETLVERILEAIEERHERISARIVGSAEWVDSFFATEKAEAEAQRTRFSLGFFLLAEDTRTVQYDARTRFRLSLPILEDRLEDRLQLVFSGDPDEEVGTDPVPRRQLRDRLEETRDQTYTASLRYFIYRTLRSNISLSTGLRLRNGTPTLLLEPRYRQDIELDPWLFRFTQRFITLSDGTVEIRTIFDFDREIEEFADDMLLRLSADGSWINDRSGYHYGLHAIVYQVLKRDRALEYSFSNFFQTVPNHRRENTRLRVLYRQTAIWEWFFVEIAPQITFPRDRNFKLTPGILLGVEVIFGAYEPPPQNRDQEQQKNGKTNSLP